MGMILSRFAESVADFDEEIPRLSLLRFLFPKRCTIRKIRRNILFPSIRYMIYYKISGDIWYAGGGIFSRKTYFGMECH